MKSRRFISLLCVIAMSLTLMLPVSAAAPEEQNTDGRSSETVYYYEEVDGNAVERIGNNVYLDGELVITVEYSDDSAEIQPRTGWVRSDVWPSNVNASDYNIYEKTVVINLKVQAAGRNLSAQMLFACLRAAGIFVGGALDDVSEKLYDYLLDNVEWEDPDYLYCRETWYKNNLMPYTRRIDCEFYMNKNASGTLTDYIPDADRTVYAAWA